MQLSLQNIGKKYNQDWIFRKISMEFKHGEAYAILGSNGSGKSTLMQVISGKIIPSAGDIQYVHHGKVIPVEDIFRYLTFSTPYQELIEEYTVPEMLSFHCQLKPLFHDIDGKEFLEVLAFPRIKNKQIRYFSSGMKQRVKLALAILSDVPMLLLDEPCANLDQQGMRWYNDLIVNYRHDRLIFVCSNHQAEETAFCSEQLSVNDYK
jgi:ABC-type multidrug transport system ATPase subunit